VKRFHFLAVILSLFFNHPIQAASTDAWQDLDYIERAFIEIALKNEYRETDLSVIKWQRPIHYDFAYYNLPKQAFIEKLAHAHFKQLQQITEHAIQPSFESGQASNFQIVLTKDKYYKAAIEKHTQSTVKNLSRESHCMATYKRHKPKGITQAVVIIPVDHVMSKGLLPACIVEEITQVMGLPNDSDWVNPSIANDASKIDLLTGLDYILLKLLYDKKLKAGAVLKDAKPIIRKRLELLEETGEIKRAARKVNRSGLYPLIH